MFAKLAFWALTPKAKRLPALAEMCDTAEMAGGQQLPEPTAQGDLARTPFAHLLLYVDRKKLTGTLVVWSGQEGVRGQDRIRFEQGVPVAARLSSKSPHLGRALLPLFPVKQAPYAFYADVDLVGQGEGVRRGSVGVMELVAASLRGSSRDDAVEAVLAGYKDRAVRLAPGADFAEFHFLPEENALVELLRARPATLTELPSMAQLPERTVNRVVYLLTVTKRAQPYRVVAEPPRAPAQPVAPPPPDLPTISSLPPAARRSHPPTSALRSGTGASVLPTPASSSLRPDAEGPDARRNKKVGDPSTAPPPPPSLSNMLRTQWDEIVARATRIENQTYFDMLGVTQNASGGDIRSAYYGLVKKWHPDRLPPELAPLRATVERIFQYLTRAHDTLSDEDKRGPYLATVQDGGGTPTSERELERIIQAAMEFRKVEVLMKRREWDDALALLGDVLSLNPEEPDYHAMRGWLLFQLHGPEPAYRSEIMGALNKALSITDEHARAHFYLGTIYKRIGDQAAALTHFRRAAEINPKHLEAVREVRLADMRSGQHARPKAGAKESFFGKLFRPKGES